MSERSNAIGLLVALAPRRRTILGLFLGEALLLSALCGLLGLAVGAAAAHPLPLLLPALPVSTPWGFALAAELLAVLIGLLAGVLPARRAASLDAVAALRAE